MCEPRGSADADPRSPLRPLACVTKGLIGDGMPSGVSPGASRPRRSSEQDGCLPLALLDRSRSTSDYSQSATCDKETAGEDRQLEAQADVMPAAASIPPWRIKSEKAGNADQGMADAESLSHATAGGIRKGSKGKQPLTTVSEDGDLPVGKATLTSDEYEERAMAAIAKRDADRARDREQAKAEKEAVKAAVAAAKAMAASARAAATKCKKPIKAETGVKTDPSEEESAIASRKRLREKTTPSTAAATAAPPTASSTALAAPAVGKFKKTPANKAYNRAYCNVMDKAKRKAVKDGVVFAGSQLEIDAKTEAVRAGTAARDAKIAEGK